MLNVRFPHALPFAVLATLAACGGSTSSSPDSGTTTHDTGTTVKPDTGMVTTHDAGVDASKTDAKTLHDTGVTDAPVPQGDASTGPVVPTGAVMIGKPGIIDILGITSDDKIVYFDGAGNLSAATAAGVVTVILPATDAGTSAVCPVAGVAGPVVYTLTDCTSHTVSGTPTLIQGTLSFWSTALGKLTQVATGSQGLLSSAVDNSYFTFIDGISTTATTAVTTGNLGVVSPSGANPVDFVKNVIIDTSSTTCAPWAVIDDGYVVASTCAVEDGGDGKPSISSYKGPTAWTSTLLTSNAGVSNLTAGPLNFTTDTSGNNILAVSSATPGPVTLSVQGINSVTQTTLVTPFAAPVSGAEYFYLSTKSAFALFTQPSTHLGIANFATPTSPPVITSVNVTDVVLGVQAVSSDEVWDVDYSTALDMSTGAPTSLNLRNIKTGVATPLIPSGSGLANLFPPNSFTADNSYVFYTTNLHLVGSDATAGTLFAAPTAGGAINQIVTNTTVWNANPLTGANIIYNQNYLPASSTDPFSALNGGATADIYVLKASDKGPGQLVVAGADAPNYFYVTSDKSQIFFTFTQPAVGPDGGVEIYAQDGLYSIKLPTIN